MLRLSRAIFLAPSGSLLFGVSVRRPGMNRVEKALGDRRVGVDAAIAEKRPVAARVFEQRKVDLADQDLFRVVRGFGDDAAEGIGEKTAAPELKARAFDAIAEHIAILVT